MQTTPADLLDNPIWSSLTTDHTRFAEGGSHARRYPEAIGPLSGMAGQSAAGYEELTGLAHPGDVLALFFREPPRPPAGWTLLRGGVLVQMLAESPLLQPPNLPSGSELRRLTPADVPAMLDLTQQTEPGPFRARTIELGRYFGIFEAGRLVSMAGERLSMPGYVEVSAVCTHPDARGRGYAGILMSRVMEGILAAGRLPFLHTWAENETAIRLYRKLGFALRRQFDLAVLQRGE